MHVLDPAQGPALSHLDDSQLSVLTLYTFQAFFASDGQVPGHLRRLCRRARRGHNLQANPCHHVRPLHTGKRHRPESKLRDSATGCDYLVETHLYNGTVEAPMRELLQ